MSNPVKPPGYFGREVDEGRFAEFLRPTFPTAPALPGAFTNWSARATSFTTLEVTIADPIPGMGDAVYYGDGAGEAVDVRLLIDGEDATGLGAVDEPTVTTVEVAAEGLSSLQLVTVATAGSSTPSAPLLVLFRTLPDAPNVTIGQGAPGELVATFADTGTLGWGDAVAPGDGAGTPGKYQRSLDGLTWTDVADPAADGPITTTFDPGLYGTDQTLYFRAVSGEGFPGPTVALTARVPTLVVPGLFDVTVDGVVVVIDSELVYVVPRVPDAFPSTHWALTKVGDDGGEIDILALPFTGYLALSGIDYRVNSGAALPTGLTSIGEYTALDLPIGIAQVQIRAVNAAGGGPWSEAKSVNVSEAGPYVVAGYVADDYVEAA